MRRLGFIFLALYLVFLGGTAYYTLVFPVRVFHHLFITLLLALWLISRLRRGRGLPSTPLNPPLYAAAVVWVLAALFSIDRRMAFEHLWFLLIHLLFFFGLVDLFQRGRQRLVIETQFLLAALIVLVSGVEIASWYFGLGIIPGTNVGWIDAINAGIWLPLEAPRLSLAMNVSTLLAGYVAPLVTITAGWALTARDRGFRIVLWVLAALLLLVLVLTFSRGGLLSLLAAAGTLVTLRLAQSPRVTQRIAPRVIIGAAITVGVMIAAGFVLLSLRADRADGDLGRVDMWRSATEITRDYPVFGVGSGMFGRAFRSYRSPDLVQDKLASAHNFILNTLAETGIAGFGVSVWLGVVFIRTWWRNKQSATGGRRLRLEAAFGALLGIGVHSLVDVFTVTPIVLLIALLAAYCITGAPYRPANPPPTPRWSGIVALLAVVAYGVWFIPIDRAHSLYRQSLSGGINALNAVREAQALDPALNLYRLHEAFLLGQQDSPQAILAYEAALELEPTWDIGWMNLAVLHLRNGDTEAAITALNRAQQISLRSPASLHWGLLAEGSSAAPDADIQAAYESVLSWSRSTGFAPLWSETELRQQALRSALVTATLDMQYRTLSLYDPRQAAALVSENPQTDVEWWVLGEHALTVEGDSEKAFDAFSQAIRLRPTWGDAYVSRAEVQTDPVAAQHDLEMADLLGTSYEYPNLVRIRFTDDPAEVQRLRANALFPRSVPQEFAAVMYGREAVFDLLPEVRLPGPGRAALSAWYDLASAYLEQGQTDAAANVYRAILDYAPFDTEARNALAALTG